MVALPASSQDVPPDASLITLGSRTFNFRADVRNMRRDDHFIPIQEVDWIANLMRGEPVFDRVVVHIREHAFARLDIWPSLDSVGTLPSEYPLTDNIPELFIVDGFQTRSSHPSNGDLVLIPIDEPKKFFVNCMPDLLAEKANCFLIAPYAPDPNLYLLARMYYPTPPFNFHEVANRMLEMAYCLDITNTLGEMSTTQENYVGPDGVLPELKGCFNPVS